MRRSVPLLACGAVACALAMTGCSNDADQPESVASSSAAPAGSPEDAAIAAYEGLVDAFNAYYQEGGGTEARSRSGIDDYFWPNATGEGIPPTLQSLDEFTQMARDGAHQEGDITVRSTKVVEYTPDYDSAVYQPNGQEYTWDRIVLEVCQDPSAVRWVAADGTETATGRPAFVMTVTLERVPEPPDGFPKADGWLISDRQSHPEQSC